ncbi:glycosyltransferase family 2 protein [Sphingomonas koreensis]|nr:glycosyltransferase family 2 protein [Sphingomonas koreensis]
MTRISFLLPTFNRARFLSTSINAILTQMQDSDELLVIDDGSDDDTAAVVGAFGPQVRYTRQENAGKSIALNRGIAMTSGEFIMICDDDDVLKPEVVPLLVEALQAGDAAFAFGTYSRFRDVAGRYVDFGTGYWPDLSHGSLTRHILEDAFVMQNAALVRRCAYEAVGAFDETMLRSLDYDMFVRLAVRFRSIYVDRHIFRQRKHEGDRGPAKALHAAASSDEVWRTYDARIFVKLYDQFPLGRYAAMFTGSDERRTHRAALLQRACVNARHDLWHWAIDDLEAAAQVVPDLPLSPTERAICGRILNGKHGFRGALDAEIAARLKRVLHNGAAGRVIIRAMLADALWRLRDVADASARRSMRTLALMLIGGTGLAKLVIARIANRMRVHRPDPGLIERTDFPLEPDIQRLDDIDAAISS